MREIIQPDPELPLRVGPEDFVEFPDLARFRIQSEELVAEELLQPFRRFVQRHRRLEHLEDACLVAHVHATLFLGRSQNSFNSRSVHSDLM